MLFTSIKNIFLTAMVALISVTYATPNYSASIHQPKIRAFIEKLNDHDHYPKQQLETILAQQKPDQHILNIEYKPYERESWPLFRKQHVSQQRIQAGVKFFKQNKQVLLQAQKQYGVDPYVIAAILGFESNYGKNIGHYHAIDSLYTLGFYYPPREKYFQNELENLLLLAKDWHRPVESIPSSFDGGLGMAQFMPDKYRQLAKAYKPNHYPNLLSNSNDAIISIANYLKQSGWHNQSWIVQPIVLVAPNHLPTCSSKRLQVLEYGEQGFVIPESLANQKIACAKLQDQKHIDYWLLGPNYYVIKKYNPDLYYALVVEAISDGIRQGV